MPSNKHASSHILSHLLEDTFKATPNDIPCASPRRLLCCQLRAHLWIHPLLTCLIDGLNVSARECSNASCMGCKFAPSLVIPRQLSWRCSKCFLHQICQNVSWACAYYMAFQIVEFVCLVFFSLKHRQRLRVWCFQRLSA